MDKSTLTSAAPLLVLYAAIALVAYFRKSWFLVIEALAVGLLIFLVNPAALLNENFLFSLCSVVVALYLVPSYMADAALAAGHPDTASKIYKGLSVLFPWSERISISRANMLFYRSKFDDALKLYEKELSTNPASLHAIVGRALTRLYMNQADLAREDLESARRLHGSKLGRPYEYSLLILAGAIDLQEGNIQSAIEQFTRAVELSPKQAEALISRAHAFCIDGQLDKAKSDLDQTAACNPSKHNEAFILSNRARVQLRSGDNSTAAQTALKASETYPDSPPVLSTYGLALHRNGQSDDALAVLSKALEIDSYCADALWFRHEVYGSMGDTARADADANAARRFAYKPYL